jgi:hypothetical protein
LCIQVVQQALAAAALATVEVMVLVWEAVIVQMELAAVETEVYYQPYIFSRGEFMTDEAGVYHKADRKRELVSLLKELLDTQVKASEVLDKKAWDILAVASATFGIAGAIEFALKSSSAGISFWIGVVAVMDLYFCLVVEVLQAIGPRVWWHIPGTADGKLSYEGLLLKYIAPTEENEYLDKLIVDYAGMKDPDQNGHIVNGAIQQAQANNEAKAIHILRAGQLLGAIVIGLTVLPFLATLP